MKTNLKGSQTERRYKKDEEMTDCEGGFMVGKRERMRKCGLNG